MEQEAKFHLIYFDESSVSPTDCALGNTYSYRFYLSAIFSSQSFSGLFSDCFMTLLLVHFELGPTATISSFCMCHQRATKWRWLPATTQATSNHQLRGERTVVPFNQSPFWASPSRSALCLATASIQQAKLVNQIIIINNQSKTL